MNYTKGFVVQAAVLFGFWLVLSGRYGLLFLGMGLVSSLLVTALTHDIVVGGFGQQRRPLATLPLRVWRMVAYLVWLSGRILVSSAQLAYIVCHPRMPLDPAMARFRTGLRSPMARTFLANTISLIPGTMTVSLDEEVYTIHVLMPSSADDLTSGRMQNIIGRVFLEAEQPPTELEWETLPVKQP